MKSIFLSILLLVFIGGCAAPNDKNSYTACPDEVGEFCAAVYQPVCGDDGITYSNSCEACQKAAKYKEGSC